MVLLEGSDLGLNSGYGDLPYLGLSSCTQLAPRFDPTLGLDPGCHLRSILVVVKSDVLVRHVGHRLVFLFNDRGRSYSCWTQTLQLSSQLRSFPLFHLSVEFSALRYVVQLHNAFRSRALLRSRFVSGFIRRVAC